MSSKKILFLVGDFAEDYEVMVPFQAIQMVGHIVHAVCPGKKPGDKIKTAIHDFEGDQTYTEKPGHLFSINGDFSGVDTGNYDALMIAGGRAPEYLRMTPRVLEIIQEFNAAQKPIAAICHGAQLLSAANIISGRSVSAYPACAAEVTLAGGRYINLDMDDALSDGNLITAPAWPAHPKWLKLFLDALGTKIAA